MAGACSKEPCPKRISSPRRTPWRSCSPASRRWPAPSGGDFDRWRTWDAAWPEFPFRSRSLNGLVLSDVLIDLAQDLLGTDDIRAVPGHRDGQVRRANRRSTTSSSTPTSRTTRLTVPRPEPGLPARSETFIYLTDVGPDNGATRFVSRPAQRAHPRGGAHPELRGLRRPLRRARRRLGAGRIDRRVPARRLPPVGGLHRPVPGPLHGARRRSSPPPWNGAATRRGRSEGSRWSGTTSSNTRPAAVDGLGFPARATPSGPRRPWPVWPALSRARPGSGGEQPSSRWANRRRTTRSSRSSEKCGEVAAIFIMRLGCAPGPAIIARAPTCTPPHSTCAPGRRPVTGWPRWSANTHGVDDGYLPSPIPLAPPSRHRTTRSLRVSVAALLLALLYAPVKVAETSQSSISSAGTGVRML